MDHPCHLCRVQRLTQPDRYLPIDLCQSLAFKWQGTIIHHVRGGTYKDSSCLDQERKQPDAFWLIIVFFSRRITSPKLLALCVCQFTTTLWGSQLCILNSSFHHCCFRAENEAGVFIWTHIWPWLECLIGNIHWRGSRAPQGRLNESESQQTINQWSSICAAAYVSTKFWSMYKTYFYNWVNTLVSNIYQKDHWARWILTHLG